ncbi:MAG TPA: ATP-binding protein [Dongiaceae bacterium]|nr:ATP-binding protein [Dongiaceae bacterium]
MKDRFMSLSLRTHLLIMASLLALPAFILIIHFAVQQSKVSLTDGIADAQKLVYNISSEQYNLTGDAEQLLTVLAQLPEIRSHNASATNAILADILKKSPHFGNMIIADKNGDVWASGLPMTSAFSLRETRTFKNTVKSRQFSSGEYLIGKISARPTIGFGYPILGKQGTVDGVIAVNINFRHFNERVTHAGLPKNSVFTLIDHNGTIINRNLAPEQFVGNKERDDVFQRMKNGADEGSSVDYGPRQSIEAYRKLRLPGEQTPYLHIRASIPLQEAQRNALLTLVYNVAFLSPFLITMFVLVIVIGNHCFLKRISKLQESAKRLAEGDLHIRVSEFVQGGELGSLGVAFDEMANKLAAREQSLLAKQLELNDLNLTLARRVEEETELRIKQERLLARHARLAAIGEMIGAIAHQWRQPLATLGATIQSIRMAWERHSIDAGFLEKAEADAQKQLYYMSDTIEDFRNFFNPEKITERFDIKEKIVDVTLLVAAQFANSGITLETIDNAPDCRLMAEGYQNEFKQSLLNLVSNAFDAIKANDRPPNDAGGIVTISVGSEDGAAVIEVRDNGCGVPYEIADKIFEPYFTSKSEGEGTGIGLYMSRLIIEESMGGSLNFTSGPDGTVFRIKLARDRSGERDNNE